MDSQFTVSVHGSGLLVDIVEDDWIKEPLPVEEVEVPIDVELPPDEDEESTQRPESEWQEMSFDRFNISRDDAGAHSAS